MPNNFKVSDVGTVTKKDLKKLFAEYSLKMESYLKMKCLYDDFYDLMIAPDIKIENSFDTGDECNGLCESCTLECK